MKKLKLMTILGTRPEIIRLSACIKACDKYFDHVLVHTGQNWDYTLNQVFFDELGLRSPDFFLNTVGENLGETMGNIISKSYEIILSEKPDAVLILGDTNSALSAISAKRLKTPIFHMEAGNRCWDWNVSEMINRKIVDHISDVNLPYTEHSRRYLLNEGIDGKTIFVTGSPMKEVLSTYRDEIEESNILEQLNLHKGKYILVSAHREENVDIESNFISLMNAINKVAETYNLPIIYSTHPRTKKWLEKRDFKFNSLVKNMKPFGFFDYNKLQKNAFCVLSDSGTLSEESSILKFPAVLIRTSTERPEVLDKGSLIIGGISTETVIQSVNMAIAMNENKEISIEAEDYNDDNISIKVVKIIQSYTDIINRTVWLKD
ncbi:non-hydrolyzing UDP-N-acetylglucosamine 2-epimerase [Holdemania massiliensis]|uniref:non-hydrolyzing UDP-N-acetylglucosamine 2-epimerase n=1 Tax=Holdemania massiliensis TaxID=1468449 RepID=UPI001F0661A1|nr:UDP-N-acetylglucosamine 2-epimerase (non-hydrolyzing) [Holdemania massiliensis]MCH1940221.1 UDP-N-acetylglucosamine 2-epimerase (non-hydrolyzing) [Holdemania massiliensis]